MAALCSAGAYLGRVVLATGQDASEYPPAAGRLPVPVSAAMMARFGPQLPCCGDGGGLRITAVPSLFAICSSRFRVPGGDLTGNWNRAAYNHSRRCH